MGAEVIDRDVWTAASQALLPETITLRRAIHEEPEIGLDCPATTAKIKEALKGLPLELREGPSTSGLMAILKGPSNGRTVLLRGDMDALPLNEDTDLDFRSKIGGAMHACGHDTHVAMLVGAAKALCAERERLAGDIHEGLGQELAGVAGVVRGERAGPGGGGRGGALLGPGLGRIGHEERHRPAVAVGRV